jgi:hypothetical protein
METPDEMLERLDRMGDDRVRALLGRGDHFEAKAVPMVRGWLERREKKRESNGDRETLPNLYRSFERLRTTARQAVEAADLAEELATKAQRMAQIAVVVGGASLLVSVLALFALAIR